MNKSGSKNTERRNSVPRSAGRPQEKTGQDWRKSSPDKRGTGSAPRISNTGGTFSRKSATNPAQSAKKPVKVLQPADPFEVFPVAIISHRAAEKLRGGHAWIYRSDVTELRPALGARSIPAGALMAVRDNRGAALGTAMYSTSSLIALRLFAAPGADGAATLSREQFLLEVEHRAASAAALRLPLLTAESDAARIVFSEADRLPGVIVDRYSRIAVVQRNTQGLAGEDVAEALTRGLLRGFGGAHQPDTIVERGDARIRELEDLPPVAPEPWFVASAVARGVHGAGPHPREGTEPTAAPEVPLTTEFRLNGLQFAFDANAGQKTGAFLDQRDNYAAAARYAAAAPLVGGVRTALDICTYQGGFALHLARVCDEVTGVDASRAALEVAERNEQANRAVLRTRGMEWLQADAFAILRDYAAAGKQYSVTVLDPPAFAKSQRAAEGALRGYKEMNLRAMQMLPPGGVLVTCSCSHHVALPEFTQAVAAAAADAGRRVTLLESRTAAPDHPVVLGLPETMYLKCLICRVD